MEKIRSLTTGKKTFVIIGAAIAVFVLYQVFMYVFPNFRINYVTFKPAIHDTSNVQMSTSTYQFGPFINNIFVDTIIFPEVNVDYDVTNTSFSLWMRKAKNPKDDFNCIHFALAQCEMKKTPKGQQYQYVLRIDSVNQVGQHVYLHKNGTFIAIDSSNTKDVIPIEDWETLIDSLEPYSFKNLPVKRYHPGI